MELNTGTTKRIEKTVFSRYSVLIYIFIFLCLVFFFYRYYDKYRSDKTKEIQNDLISVAKLKIHDIDSWRFERLADGRVLRRNVVVPRVTEKILKGNASKQDYDDILAVFSSFKNVYSYHEIKLIDTEGNILLSDSLNTQTSSHVKSLLPEVIKNKKTIITDFHFHDSNGMGKKPHLDVVVPIQFDGSDEVRAFVVLEINPEKYLYPLMRDWPVETKTAETLIFENDGNGSALFLNPLRHIDNEAMTFRIDKSQTNVLAIQALNGKSGFAEGVDYRGVEVLGYCAKIDDSNWYIIAKIDRDEAYSELNEFTFWFLGVLFLFIIIFVYVVSYSHKKERAKYFEDLYRVEAEKKTLMDNYKYVIENANDAILMTDLSGRIIDANERAEKLYLYSKEEFQELKIDNLVTEERMSELQNYFDHVTHQNGHIFETYGMKKDETVFPIESSSRLININGDKFIQSIIRDITIKKRAEKTLRESEQRFATSFHNNPAWLTIVNMDTFTTIEVNDAWCKTFEYSKEEALGTSVVALGIYTEKEFRRIIEEVRVKRSIKNAEVSLKVRSGKIKTCLISREILRVNNIDYLYAMGIDITERKKAENEVKERELLFRTTLYSIGDGVITTDAKGNVQRMNAVAENLTGWKENEAEGRRLEEVFKIISEDSLLVVESPVDKILREGLVVGLANHTLLISKDGRQTPIADSGAPIKTDTGVIIGVVLVFRDQSEERAREDELRGEEMKFRSLFENTLEGIALHELVYDKNGKAVNYRILDVNENFTKILGFDKNKAKGSLATDLYKTKEAPFLEVYAGVAQTQKPYTFEVYFEPLKKHFSIAAFSPGKNKFATAFSDITERKTASEILARNEERYRRISAVISDIAYSCVEIEKGIFVLDWMTGGVEQLTGYTHDEVMEKKCWKFLVSADDLKLFETNVTQVKPGNIAKTEFRLNRKNGEIIWVQSEVECVQESEGRKRIYGGIIDITDRKKTEEAIRETETMFSMAFRNSPNAMIIASAKDNRYVDVNEVFLHDTGYTREEVKGKTSRELGLFRDISDRDALVKEVREKGFARNVELVFRTKTGEDVYGLISMSLIYMRGEPYLLSTIANLTEMKTAERRLKRSEEKYRRLHESITDAVIMVDMKGNLLEWNASYRDMLGYTDEELARLTYIDITPEDWHESELRIVEDKIIPHGDSGVYQKEYRRKDGTVFPIELRTYLIKNDKGEPEAMWAVIRDITERKEFEAALIKAKEKAEEMNRLKSNFLANMSHELRTPMTGILGFSEMLSEEIADENHRQMAEVIYHGGKRLMNTLNLILNLSKLESESLKINFAPVNMSELAESTVRMFEVLASNKNLNLVVDVEKDIYANLDEQFTSQIISNLVQNAITFTNDGFVSVSLKTERTGSDEFAVLKVKDTGIGIREEHHGVIFEPFRQVSEGFNRSYEGTGLGLTITKKYVELMNGSINVKSETGKGTEFTVKFPALGMITKSENPAKTSGIAERQRSSGTDKRILIVEDDDSNAKMFDAALKGVAALDFAGNGEDALDMIKYLDYSVIIMDIGLPGISGIDAVKLIRENEKYKSVPIIAVTAYAMAGDREIFLSEGCSHYISKPFSPIELVETVSGLLNDGN